MKVALLSFHNAFNYGAALQAYALQSTVEDMGVECEYIDYVNTRRKAAYHMPSQFAAALTEKKYIRALRVLLGTPFIVHRGRMFRKFYAAHLHTTEKTYHSSQEASELNNRYDKFIVGSDQVWNYDNNGADWAYLLDFVTEDKKKISYSSSFGVRGIPQAYKNAYQTCLAHFDRLAVREEMGVKLVAQLTGRKAHLVLDPVFLVGVGTWDTIRRSIPNKANGDYVFFYTNQKRQVQDFLDTGYPVKGLSFHILSSHVTLSDFINPRVRVRTAMPPETFLNEIAGAKLVVTASFHCLAFAVLYHKPVCVLLSGDPGKDERILSLLRITGMESRILTPETTVQNICEDIDYDRVDAALRPYYEKSREYLRRAVFDMSDLDFKNETVGDGEQERFCTDSRCTGCSACRSSCPVNAIQMVPDEEGFLHPQVEENRCLRCGICHDVCQVFAERAVNSFQQRYFAFKNRNDIREKSSSGGAFTALSDSVLKKNGIIAAACMDEHFHVRHIITEDPTDRDRMRGTFYVQSDLGECFSKIQSSLKDERQVLFVGTPCQVQGLKLFLKREWENLITVDLVCHGAPSPMVFDKFIAFLKQKGKLEQFLFRDKSLGWKGYHVSAVIDGDKVKDKLWLQSFNDLFSHNLINRKSCSDCPYTNYERAGDLTIGDFWGIKDTLPGFYDEHGVSLILCNTAKGYEALTALDSVEMREVKKEQTRQNSLIKPAKASANRNAAFRLLKNDGYEALARHFGEWSCKGYIKNILRKWMFS